MIVVKFLFLVLFVGFSNTEKCNLSDSLINEIRGYKTKVNQIIEATTKGKFKGKTYEELATFVDKFGARQAGSQSLEDAIDYMLELMKSDGYNLDNVHEENVTVPHWVRGAESAQMTSPRIANIPVLALGGSVATPTEGIAADVIVFKNFEELEANATKVNGKIVVFNNDFVSYGVSVAYRTQGPLRAAKYNALAVLVRSVTPFSMNTLHTGQTNYDQNLTKIPAASITVEHAHMFQRYQDRNQKITLKLNLQSQPVVPSRSRNTVAEVAGTANPEKVVIVSGHLDSWDVGVGAMDDGGGAFISWYSLVVLKALNLLPRRTVRAVLWTAEENGMAGVHTYSTVHKNETGNFIFIMESDEGTFTPRGIEYHAGQKGGCILQEIVNLLTPIGAGEAQRSEGGVGSDIGVWTDIVPTGSLLNANEKYFWFHHTESDTMDVLDPDALDKATALWASVAYIIADLQDDFPRDFTPPVDSGSRVVPSLVFSMLTLIIVKLLSL